MDKMSQDIISEDIISQNMVSEKKFIFFGEVDCGKSSTAGHLYVQCGGLSDHELAKIRNDCKNKQYQLWSRVLDIWEEEQEKGKTHEFNLLSLTFKGIEYKMIDQLLQFCCQ